MGDSDIDTLLAKLAATPRKSAPATTFSGTRRFEIRRRVGGGAFGDVYEARDREHGALVALKALKSSHPDWIYRFKREFRLVGDLSHPNIARLFELFCEEERWYLTMELIDGLRFDEHIERAPDQLRSCFAQVAHALAALHATGCLHRDVKPSNALVESTGRVVLLDFGLAFDSRGAQLTAIAGTPPFMAPELASGDQPTAASDWYSFGVMLYRVLAGELPFRGSHGDIFAEKLANRPVPPSRLRPGVDPALEALALRLLAPAASERPTGDEIIAELDGGRPRRLRGGRDEDSLVVGRDRDLAVLDRAFAEVAAGHATVATIRGEPGIGKSTLLRAFVDRCTDRGAQVYSGRCHETESVPYKGLDAVIDALCNDLSRRPSADVVDLVPPDADALAQMFPVFKRVAAFARAVRDPRTRGPQDARRRASRALRQLLERLSRRAAVVLAIDELHWASRDGIQLLLELAAPPAPAILLVVAYRSEEGAAAPGLGVFMGALPGLGIAKVDVPVEPLDREAVALLLAARGAAEVPVDQVMRETGGHPFLLRHLIDAHGWHSRAGDVGGLLAATIAELTPPARALLEAVSVATLPISERTAFSAIDEPPDPAVVDELRRSRLVQRRQTAADAELEAYHDRVRETVLATMPAALRRELHQRLAESLEARGRVEAEVLAHHYRHAGDRARASMWSRRAATSAAGALAFARAAELLVDAAELADDDRTRLALLEELAEARVQTGRRADGGETCLEAAAIVARLDDTSRHAGLRARAGIHFLLAGHFDRGFELVGAVLAEVGIELPPTPTLAVAHSINLGGELATRGLAFERRAAEQVDPAVLRRIDLSLEVASALSLTDIRGPWIATRALLDALAAGEPARVQLALAFFVLNNSARAADHPLVVAAARSAHALGVELGLERGLAWYHLAEGMRGIRRLELIRAIEDCRDAERRFLAIGGVHAREAALARIAVGLVCGSFGVDVAWATGAADELGDEALARGDLFAANWARLLHCWTSLAAGDPAAARRHTDDARRTWPSMADSFFAATSLTNEMAIHLYEDPGTAWATVERLTPEYRRMYSSLMTTPRIVYDRLAAAAAIAALDAGHADRDTTLARIEPLLQDVESLEHAEAIQFLLRSYRCAAAGDRAGCEAMLERCRQGWAGSRQRAHELTAAYRLGQLRGDPKAVERAEQELRALTVADPDRYALILAGPLPRALLP